MNPHAHLIGGILLGAIGYKLGFIQFYDIFSIGLIAVLIDIDHYIHYITLHKDFHPKRFWNITIEESEKKHISARTFIHHKNGMAAIFPALLALMIIDLRIGYIGFAAYLSHMLLDHLRYFHVKLAPYRESDILGFNVKWNSTEEVFFVTMMMVSIAVLI